MERSIDELLSGTPDEAPAVEQAPEPTPEAEAAPADEEQPRGPDGKFLPKQTGVEGEPATEPLTEAAPPAADQLPRDVYEPLKAVRNENRELKQQIEALNQRFASLPQPPAQVEPEVEFWDNPKGAIASEVQRAVQEVLQAQQQQQTKERLDVSETAAKGKYADYDDAFRAFQQAASANPSLVRQMTAASDPAEFAYRKGKTALELEQVGSIDELLKNERAKWEQEARAAMPAPSALPSTTATDGSVGGRTGPAWGGPPTIDEMLR